MNSKSANSPHSIIINNNLDLQITNQELTNFDAVQISINKWHVLHKEKSLETEIIESDFNTRNYKVKVDNNIYIVHINNELDLLVKELGFELGINKKVSDIKAPMPGLILDINVKIGQEVKENDPLLILEAMKMENVIISPRDGIIKSITVEKGTTVDKNHLLIEFEL